MLRLMNLNLQYHLAVLLVLWVGIANPGVDPEIVYLTPGSVPDGWNVSIEPAQISLAPEELKSATIMFQAPADFNSTEVIVVNQEFADGTPGVMDFEFFFESTVSTEESSWGGNQVTF